MNPTRIVAAVVLGLFAAVSFGRAEDMALDPVLKDFEPNGEYAFEIEGRAELKAEIFRAGRIPAFLILSPSLPKPLLLQPRDSSVSEISPGQVVRRGDGAIDLRPGAPVRLGSFSISGDTASFASGGRAMAMTPKPVLTGLHSGAELEAHNTTFKWRANRYVPNAQALADLRANKLPIRVEVVFGSWCPHCQHKVPLILATERALRGSAITFEYFGLPGGAGAWQDAEAKRLGITAVPTAVITVNGRELGRLLTAAWDAPEVVLSKIVAANRVP